MKVKQICIKIENYPERIQDVYHLFSQASLQLYSFMVVDSGQFSEVRVIPKNLEKAIQVVMHAQLPSSIIELVAIKHDDKAGILETLFKPIFKHHIQIVFMSAMTIKDDLKALSLFHFSDNDKAIDILTKEGYKIFEVRQ